MVVTGPQSPSFPNKLPGKIHRSSCGGGCSVVLYRYNRKESAAEAANEAIDTLAFENAPL